MFEVQVVPWGRQLEQQSRKGKVVGSNPTMDKNFSFCNSSFTRAADTLA